MTTTTTTMMMMEAQQKGSVSENENEGIMSCLFPDPWRLGLKHRVDCEETGGLQVAGYLPDP